MSVACALVFGSLSFCLLLSFVAFRFASLHASAAAAAALLLLLLPFKFCCCPLNSAAAL